jgi:hypothetical protein
VTDTELDALLAVHVFGENLKPSRDLALARVGMKRVSCTGEPFTLHDGRTVSMNPMALILNCTPLKKPEDSTDWNDRYYRRVGEFLGDAVAAEVDAYRLPAKPRSSTGDGMLAVIASMHAKGWHWSAWGFREESGFEFRRRRGDPTDTGITSSTANDGPIPRLCALAALRALGVETVQ